MKIYCWDVSLIFEYLVIFVKTTVYIFTTWVDKNVDY